MRKISPGILRTITVIGLIFLWEAASRIGVLSPHALPPPDKVASALIRLAKDGFPQSVLVVTHLQMTLMRISQGFVLAAAIGVPLGMIIGQAPLLQQIANPVITAARSIAAISLLPLFIAWFGVGELQKVLLICYGAFWVIITSTIHAASSVDRNYIQAARMLGASRSTMFFRVTLPASLPRIFGGLRTAVGLCFMIIIAVEMVGTVTGLGALIQQARSFYRADIAIAGTVLIGASGLLIAVLLDHLERLVLPWAVGLQDIRR